MLMGKYTLNGDLCQMSTQMQFLIENGFDVGQSGCYPYLDSKQEYDRAIKLIFENRVEGWWNYRDALPEIELDLLYRRKSIITDELKDIEKRILELEKETNSS
jgi:hypothetical protein